MFDNFQVVAAQGLNGSHDHVLLFKILIGTLYKFNNIKNFVPEVPLWKTTLHATF
jgi:hypothetical protein